MHLSSVETVQGAHRRPTFLKVLPTFGKLDIAFHVAAQRLIMPVNALVDSISITMSNDGWQGDSGVDAVVIRQEEIGRARNLVMERVLSVPQEQRPEFIFFFGDDMIPGFDCLLNLWEAARKDPTWDVLAALYYVKQDYWPVPILWREEVPGPLREGEHYQAGEVVASDICGLDFTLVRPEIFEKIPPPWFKTGPTETETGGIWLHTEDAWMVRKVKDAGGKVGVHTGVRVGHLDVRTGEVY